MGEVTMASGNTAQAANCWKKSTANSPAPAPITTPAPTAPFSWQAPTRLPHTFTYPIDVGYTSADVVIVVGNTGQITEYNIKSKTQGRTLAPGIDRPTSIAVDATRSYALVTEMFGSARIMKIDLSSGSASEVARGTKPHGIAINAAGT